jgi:hypothetical protein
MKVYPIGSGDRYAVLRGNARLTAIHRYNDFAQNHITTIQCKIYGRTLSPLERVALYYDDEDTKESSLTLDEKVYFNNFCTL